MKQRSASLTSPRCQRAIPRPRYPLLSGRIAAKPAELLFGFRQAPLSEVEFPQNSAGLHVKRRQGNGAPHLDLENDYEAMKEQVDQMEAVGPGTE